MVDIRVVVIDLRLIKACEVLNRPGYFSGHVFKSLGVFYFLPVSTRRWRRLSVIVRHSSSLRWIRRLRGSVLVVAVVEAVKSSGDDIPCALAQIRLLAFGLRFVLVVAPPLLFLPQQSTSLRCLALRQTTRVFLVSGLVLSAGLSLGFLPGATKRYDFRVPEHGDLLVRKRSLDAVLVIAETIVFVEFLGIVILGVELGNRLSTAATIAADGWEQKLRCKLLDRRFGEMRVVERA